LLTSRQTTCSHPLPVRDMLLLYLYLLVVILLLLVVLMTGVN
jgi:hypothetical protein